MPCEVTHTVYDKWWFEDDPQKSPFDCCSKDDAMIGPQPKTVHINASIGWIEGQVTLFGDPMTSWVELWKNEQQIGNTVTDAQGTYSFHFLEPGGGYKVKATAAGGGEKAGLTVVPGQGTTANSTLEGGQG